MNFLNFGKGVNRNDLDVGALFDHNSKSTWPILATKVLVWVLMRAMLAMSYKI